MRRILLVLAALGAGCAARPPNTAPAPSIDAYEHELDTAEARLRAAGVAAPSAPGAETGAGAAPAQAAPAPNAPPPPEAAAEAPAREADEEAPAPEKERAETGCEAACRAYASMRRAADGICEIAGASDARCVRAHQRVSDAGELLKKSGCGCS